MSTSQRINTRFGPGTVIEDKYEIVRHLGEGGFASVFLARQRLIDREVAIKILHTKSGEAGGASFEDRFLLEAKVAAKIAHPNVVTIFDFGFTGPDREPFLVMEYLVGRELEDELNSSGGLEPRRAIALFTTALKALGEGHDAHVVHKDLKPANLYLTHPGTHKETLKILDFGVARLVDAGTTKMTSTGQMFGTPQYMAPEYIERNEVTPALDVYQMGLILVEAITGSCVVDAETSYLCCVVHCRGELEIPASLLDGPLGAVLAKALAVDPSDRFPDANAFAKALESIDASDVHYSPKDRTSRRLSGVSSSLRGVASSGTPRDTGGFGAGNSGALAFDETHAVDRPTIVSPQPKRSIGVLVAVVGLLLVLVVGAGAVVAVLISGPDGSDEPTPTVNAPLAGTEALPDSEEPEVDADKAEAPDDSAEDAGAGAEVAVPAPVAKSEMIQLDTTPSGASVYLGRRKLGTTPVAVKRPDEVTTFSVRLKRFESAAVVLGPDTEDATSILLAAKDRRATRSPTKTGVKSIPAVKNPTPTKPVAGFDFADGKKPGKTKVPTKKKKSADFGFAD